MIDEMVPLGVFRISSFRVDDSGDGLSMEIEGFDRSRQVQRYKYTDTYSIAAGTNYVVALQGLLLDRMPTIQFSPNFPATTLSCPTMTWNAGDDPWNAAQRIATALGMEVYFDASGYCMMSTIPDPLTAPVVWQYAEGEDATFLYLSKRFSDENVVNYWVVTGEGTANASPIRAVAYDNEPGSPTYVGTYGIVSDTFSDNMITDLGQAQSVANAKLAASRGASEDLSLNVIVNPAHEERDVVSVVRSESRINGRYMIDSFTMPLESAQALPIETRRAT
jgi:hypothetical protein